MDQIYDVIIIGGGAAAASAVLTLKNRGKSTAVVSNRAETGSLYKAEQITNYPGLPPMSGAEMSALFRRQIEEAGALLIEGRAISVMPMEDMFGVAVGSDYYMAKSLILGPGITREKLYPGEAEYLGRGVSYCATCDTSVLKRTSMPAFSISFLYQRIRSLSFSLKVMAEAVRNRPPS